MDTTDAKAPLTGNERKQLTETKLAAMGVTADVEWPATYDHSTAIIQPAQAVASRAIALYATICVAWKVKAAKEMQAWLQQNDLWDKVSEDEQNYISKQERLPQDNILFTWRLEALNVLLWALGACARLEPPVKFCDLSGYNNLPPLDADPAHWLASATLRPAEEILNEADMAWRIYLAVHMAAANKQPIPAGIDDGIAYERSYAFAWLLGTEDWDDVNPDETEEDNEEEEGETEI